MCREIEMGVAACQHALHHSGLHEGIRNPERTGIVYGSDYILTRPEEYIDGMIACRDSEGHVDVEEWPEKGIPNVNPLWLLKYLPNMPASHVAIYNDLRGPSNSITIREASNNLSIAEAVSCDSSWCRGCDGGWIDGMFHPSIARHPCIGPGNIGQRSSQSG